jgi:aspartate carbamoyltransferase catalytic subunit
MTNPIIAEKLEQKDLLSIDELTAAELELVLKTAKPFKDLFKRSVKKVPPLKGKTVLLLFYEPSTRTRTSFDIAAKRLSADVASFSISSSSVVKGESILDTVKTLESMRADYIVVRHKGAGVANLIARNTPISVINAGDGYHAHPTQAILDAYTLKEVYGDLKGKRILIIGDILHSRVARSTMQCCHKLGMEVGIFGPATLLPPGAHEFIKPFYKYQHAMAWKPNVIYLLRLQLERQKANFFPSMREYHQTFGINRERFREVEQQGIYIMHPGPVNRGVELVDEVMDYDRCLINQQVENGIATRMAILYLLHPTNRTKQAAAVEDIL